MTLGTIVNAVGLLLLVVLALGLVAVVFDFLTYKKLMNQIGLLHNTPQVRVEDDHTHTWTDRDDLSEFVLSSSPASRAIVEHDVLKVCADCGYIPVLDKYLPETSSYSVKAQYIVQKMYDDFNLEMKGKFPDTTDLQKVIDETISFSNKISKIGSLLSSAREIREKLDARKK